MIKTNTSQNKTITNKIENTSFPELQQELKSTAVCSEAYLGPYRTSMMSLFVKIANDLTV